MDYARKEREERFAVTEGGKRYTFADVDALPDDVRAEKWNSTPFQTVSRWESMTICI